MAFVRRLAPAYRDISDLSGCGSAASDFACVSVCILKGEWLELSTQNRRRQSLWHALVMHRPEVGVIGLIRVRMGMSRRAHISS